MMKKRMLNNFLFGLLLCVPKFALAEDVNIKELLKELKSLKNRVEQLEAEKQKEIKTPAKELDAITADKQTQTSAPSNKSDLSQSYVRDIISNTTVGGYASTEFENFQDTDSTFDPHRFILNVSSQLNKRLRFYSEIEFEHGTVIEGEGSGEGTVTIEDSDGDGVISSSEATDVPVSLDVKNGRGGELALEQAWMQYDFSEKLGLRTGVILVPFGRYNLYHDDDLNNLTDRPVVARRVIPTTWSDAGLGFVGKVELGDEATISSEVYMINGLNDEFSAGSGGLRNARDSMEQDNNNNKAVVGRLAFSPLLGQEVALSGYNGNYDRDGNALSAAAFDWTLTAAGFNFLGEAALFSFDEGLNSSGSAAPDQISGLYAEINYPFWVEGLNQTFLGSSFEDPKLIPSFRYNYAEIDRTGTSSTLDEKGFVLGLTYRPVQSFAIKTEYQWNTGDLERKDSDGFIGSIAMGF